MKSLSIVSTLYKSAPYIEEFLERVSKAAKKLTHELEIILVNDGSPDNSLEICQKISKNYPELKVVNLSKNFGHHPAMMAGLRYTTKDFVFLIDCDLEEQPEDLVDFYEELKNRHADVVYGYQDQRKGSFHSKIFGSLYYKVFKCLSGIPIQKNVVTMRLMTKQYVEALLSYQEKEIIIGGLWYIVGFEQVPMLVNKKIKSSTSYTFSKLASYFIDSIISFSFKPLYIFCYLGLSIFCISIIYSAYVFIRKVVSHSPIDGWTSLIMSIWFLGGTTILFLSVISLYLAKIFSEVKSRPRSIVKNILFQEET